MKKVIVAFLLAVVVTAIVFAFFVKRKLALVDVATLVPAQTIALFHLPDVPRTRERWGETALAAIAREPEVIAFMERPKSQFPQWIAMRAQLDRVLTLEPREVFVAGTSLAGPKSIPLVVGGFSFNGKKEELEAVLGDLKKQLQTIAPTGKSDLVSHQGVAIETFTAEGFNTATALVKQWFFFANDLDLLKRTLDRFSAAPGDDSLRKHKPFASSQVRMAADHDTLSFIQPKEIATRLAGIVAATGQPVNPGLERLREIEAFSATTKLEGRQIRDTAFMLKPRSATDGAMTRDSLTFTSPDTLFYYAALAGFNAPNWKLPDPALDATGMLQQLEALRLQLEQQGVKWSDFAAAFGPETSFHIDWPPAAAQPSLLITCGVRDAAKARHILDVLANSNPAGSTWAQQTIEGTQYYAMQTQGIAFVSPTIALADKFVVVGLSFDSVKMAVAKLGTSGDRIDKTPEFAAAARLVNPPGSGFGYIAARPLFERIYGTARPFAIMWAGFAPKVSAFIDVNKLPATETISKHLGPMVLSQSATADGVLTESVGPLTFNQGTMLLGAGVVAAAIPFVKSQLGKTPAPVIVPPGVPSVPGSAPQPAPMPEATPDESDVAIAPPAPADPEPSETPSMSDPAAAPKASPQ